MAAPHPTGSATSDPRPPERDDAGGRVAGVPVRTLVWAVLSLAFLGYSAFGSVGARIWRFGQLHVESRSIASTWRVQGEHLPDVSPQWLIEFVFYGSIVVFVICVVAGMRLLLADPATEQAHGGDDQA